MPHSKLLPAFRRFLQRARQKLEWIGYQRVDEQAGRSVRLGHSFALPDGSMATSRRWPADRAILPSGFIRSRKLHRGATRDNLLAPRLMPFPDHPTTVRSPRSEVT